MTGAGKWKSSSVGSSAAPMASRQEYESAAPLEEKDSSRFANFQYYQAAQVADAESSPKFYTRASKKLSSVDTVVQDDESPALSSLPFDDYGDHYDKPSSFICPNEPLQLSVEAKKILRAPVDPEQVQIKPDGIIYLPEIKYRQILLDAFGPGNFSLVAAGPHSLVADNLSREYMLLIHGKFVSMARGSMPLRNALKAKELISSAGIFAEAVRSNALVRCCKDLGIAHELWDPFFIASWKAKYAEKRSVVGPYGKSTIQFVKRSSPFSESNIDLED